MPILKVTHLDYAYDKHPPALADIGFELDPGEYLGILGGNGSGKTTLLRLILGLEKIQSGSIELFGTPLSEFREWERIGYIPQYVFRGEANFPATALEVVESGHTPRSRSLAGHSGAKCAEAREALQMCGIESLAARRLGELSGGERQRVFIARALISRPELLVLDEPTTSVDAEYEEDLYALLRKLHAEGMTIILVSHDQDVVARDTTRLLCLDKKMLCYTKTGDVSLSELDSLLSQTQRVIHHNDSL